MDSKIVEVLLVEDSSTDAELIIRELRKHNMSNNLVHLRNGEEALDFIFAIGKYAGVREVRDSPKVILLDIHMPKVNGIEVLEKIKSDPRTRSIPVVILTSSKENPDIKKCYELGVNSYIVKPVDFDGFTKAMKNLGLYWLLINQPPE